jgi:hypothetical protein
MNSFRVTRLSDFSAIGLFLEPHWDNLKKMKEPKEMATILATFNSSNFFTISRQYDVLKHGLMLMFLDFKIELSCKYFGTIWLGNCFGYFLKIWVIFSAFWSP